MRFLLIPVALLATNLLAQDIHLTQFPQSPLLANPALTGDYEGAGLIYRSQWRSIADPYVTLAAHGQTFLPVGFSKAGFGLTIMRDAAGPGAMSSTQALLSAAYHLALGRTSFIIGAQPGVVRRNIKPVTYPNQYDNSIGDFNIGLPNGEGVGVGPRTYFDLNAGVGLSVQLASWKLFLGQAFQHVIQPEYSLISGTSRLPIRRTATVIADGWISPALTFQPAVLWSDHAGATEINLQSRFYINVASGTSDIGKLMLGGGVRNNTKGFHEEGLLKSSDAGFLMAGLTFKDTEFSVAYDFNISALHEASGYRGAFELALVWKNTKKMEHSVIVPPCIRL